MVLEILNCDKVYVLIFVLHPRVVHLLCSLLVAINLEGLLLVLKGGDLSLQLDDLILVVLVCLFDV